MPASKNSTVFKNMILLTEVKKGLNKDMIDGKLCVSLSGELDEIYMIPVCSA